MGEVRRSVLFTCANANQAANAVAVAERLMPHGIAAEFMVLDPVYQQGAGPVCERSAVAIGASVRHVPSRRLDVPFATLPMRDRLAAVRARARAVIDASGDHAAVVAGMDGAFERLVLRRYRQLQRVTAILWDGLIKRPPSLWSQGGGEGASLALRLGWATHFAFRRAVMRAAARAGVEPYVPGLAGHTPVDVVYTMGQFVTRAFQSQGVTTQIETTGIPRLGSIASIGELPPQSDRVVLYLTGSFAWHDERDFDRWQQQDLDQLAAELPPAGWELRIRIHPREDPSRYERFRQHAGVIVSSGAERPLAEDLQAAAAVVTAMSTAGLEALAAGRPLIVFLGAFPDAVREMTLGAHPRIPVARSVANLLMELLPAGDAQASEKVRSVLDDFVAPGSADAAERIAASVAGRLR